MALITRVDPPAQFKTARFEVQTSQYQPNLLIIDHDYWQANEWAIQEWMAENLPRGIHHQFGAILSFENERDRMAFLLRWGP